MIIADLTNEDTANSKQNAEAREKGDFSAKSPLLLLLHLPRLQYLLKHAGRPLGACIALGSSLLIEQSAFGPLHGATNLIVVQFFLFLLTAGFCPSQT